MRCEEERWGHGTDACFDIHVVGSVYDANCHVKWPSSGVQWNLKDSISWMSRSEYEI